MLFSHERDNTLEIRIEESIGGTAHFQHLYFLDIFVISLLA